MSSSTEDEDCIKIIKWDMIKIIGRNVMEKFQFICRYVPHII